MVGAAAEGGVYDGCRLNEDVVLVLGESAQGIYVLRGLRASDWLKIVHVLVASLKAVEIALGRSGRVAGRLSMQGAPAPSLPVAKLTGMDGAIAAWVAKSAADMDADGTLHGDVDEGGLGVPRAAFRPSGYLTDAGGMNATEYQKLVAAESKAVATADRIAASRENCSHRALACRTTSRR